ncbi:hypothetical protein [Desemzia incerta]|uniref:hypothetical protein n=1 Tax=Desemzia incerta TaxID=82801 RepID=UPI003314AFB2
MDALFFIIMLGLLAYSGIFIFVFFIRALVPKNSGQKRNPYSSPKVNTSNRNQQRADRREAAPRNTSRSVTASGTNRSSGTAQSWRELAADFKEAMNELDNTGSKQKNTQKRNTAPKTASPTKRNTAHRSYEGGSSSEGRTGYEGVGSTEGRSSYEGLGSSEGTASYEGTEFHTQGHSMKKTSVQSRKPSRNAYSTKQPTLKTNLQRNIVQAVIYKEILDQPRSKRPIR